MVPHSSDVPMSKKKYRKKKQNHTGASINSGVVKIVLWVQNCPLSEMMRSCKLVKCLISHNTGRTPLL